MYFLRKAYHNLLALKNTRQYFSTWRLFKTVKSSKKKKKAKNVALNKLQKGYCSQYELKQEGRTLSCSTSARNMCVEQLKCSLLCECPPMTMKVLQVLILGLQINCC